MSRQSIEFHVKSDDYFGTLAAVLSLVRQQIDGNIINETEAIVKVLKNIEKDLMFLQKEYRIVKK